MDGLRSEGSNTMVVLHVKGREESGEVDGGINESEVESWTNEISATTQLPKKGYSSIIVQYLVSPLKKHLPNLMANMPLQQRADTPEETARRSRALAIIRRHLQPAQRTALTVNTDMPTWQALPGLAASIDESP